MKKTVSCLAAAMLIAGATSPTVAQDSGLDPDTAAGVTVTPAPVAARPESPHLYQQLTRLVPARMAANDVAGVVIVVLRGGTPVWTRAFGMADPATGREMTDDALFRVESISKPVTAWGAMRLAETGKFDLHAPAAACLSDRVLPAGTARFTAQHLLSHTAGIGLGDYAARYDPEEARPSLTAHLARDFTQTGTPGAGFAYSDTGFNLLELMIENCTGEDFAALMAREVLIPLGMHASSFDWTGAEMPVGHDLRGRPVAAYVYPAHASGGLHSTAADIARFATANMAGAPQSVLSPDAVRKLHRPVVQVGGLFGIVAESYGLGYFTETLSDGRAAVWHGGQGYGWMTHLHIVPETGNGIVILANSQRAWPLFAEVLRTWSESIGVAPVGMTRVLWAEMAARFSIGLLILTGVVALWGALRRRARGRKLRILAGGLAVPLIGTPIWAAVQDYLFLFSILPGLWPWIAAAAGLTGLGLGAIALGPGERT